jgi:hypothetical protein
MNTVEDIMASLREFFKFYPKLDIFKGFKEFDR